MELFAHAAFPHVPLTGAGRAGALKRYQSLGTLLPVLSLHIDADHTC